VFSTLIFAIATGYSWYVQGTDPVTLVHGARETDERDFYAACKRGN
jgi:hypothetical protein